MRSFHALPTYRLQPYIDRFWGWESDIGESIALPQLLPGTGSELYFHYRTPFHVGHGATLQKLSPSHLLCLRQQTIALNPASDVGFVAVRFKAGMLQRFTAVPMRELTDRQLMPSDLWGVSGRTLEDSMQHAILRSAKLSLLEQFFLHKLSPAYSDLLMERAVQMLYASGGQMAIEEVSQRLHLGRRQLEKRFLLTTSQTPVQMRQLVRFQRVVKALMRDPFAKELETALLHGYYDHAHFIKNFRQFSGAAPQIYLRKAREKTHFYNSSIRTSDNIHSLATSERKNSHVYINR